jgi:hypothetical protein
MYLYLTVALLDMAVDAEICAACSKKYNFLPSFFTALAWPITIPLRIYVISKLTRNLPKWKFAKSVKPATQQAEVVTK